MDFKDFSEYDTEVEGGPQINGGPKSIFEKKQLNSQSTNRTNASVTHFAKSDLALERLYLSGLRLADLLTLIFEPDEEPVLKEVANNYAKDYEFFTKVRGFKDQNLDNLWR